VNFEVQMNTNDSSNGTYFKALPYLLASESQVFRGIGTEGSKCIAFSISLCYEDGLSADLPITNEHGQITVLHVMLKIPINGVNLVLVRCITNYLRTGVVKNG